VSTDIAARLAREAEHYEEHYNDPESNPAPGRRRGGGPPPRLLTIRLSADQHEHLAREAAARDLPVSTFARNALMDSIAQSETPAVAAQLEDALRHVLKPELLRTA